MPEQLIVGFNPMPAANKVAYCGSQIRSRILWLIVAVVICVWIWLWQRQTLTTRDTVLLFAVGMAFSLVWLGIAFVAWVRAKSALAAISPGMAACVNRTGIWLQGAGMGWSEIDRINVSPGRFGGSPILNVRRTNGQVASVSVANLDVMVGTIDAAIRSYSCGTQWVDVSKLGN